MGSYVLTGFARKISAVSLSHAGVKVGSRIGLAALVLLAAAGVVHDATASNETRTLSFHHTHSGEDLSVTFKRDGRYDEAALKQLNHFLRDWRTQDETVMDRHLFDILWEVYRDVDAKQPIQIISSYRSPATNAMLRRRSSGVARFSQHMLGHAMDFYIPGVPLEQIRFAGLRLQRGGVGFYPTSGSPFVHLDTGSIRHWPRMTHDQLAKVFPDGRTVHLPTDGVPLKGYELARADIERRGTGDDAVSKPNFFAALFKGKSVSTSEEDDEGAPAASEKPAAPTVVAAAAKPADPVPTPRAKPQVAAALQLASADAQLVAPAKPKPAPVADKPADAKPETPADIINARGFWDTPATPQQATPAQIAALKARQALAAATDPQPTASVSSSAYEALAYAPAAASPVDRAKVIAASAPIPRTGRPASRSLAQATEINTVVAKSTGAKSTDGAIATSARLSAAKGESIWLKIVMLSPSASRAMSVTLMGEIDMAAMRAYFVKPQAVIAMGFTDDPMQGMSCDSFSGSASTKLEMTSFLMHTAALR
ncbi:ATP-binding protein [Bradyrhizobium centrolobii]|uniref:Murein endopeptidase K n=1 Tax=Bradyrhizobium centrolobii TaxID=1505087 RepID=A0A176YMP7_9BRAD|nr:DUF882 domain-containing protein [Bradyrhizobium centrolobii]OAF08405.1 ATP-binding protein [Bradyrhizobium centrolobii]